MNLVLLTFYFPPDISAGSFRAKALIDSLSRKLNKETSIHIITTFPSRYKSYKVEAKKFEQISNVNIHRIKTPTHSGNLLSQCISYIFYSIKAITICFKLKPVFIVGTTSRLMTGILTAFISKILRCRYYLDIRDIFSESFSENFFKERQKLSDFVRKFFLISEKIN